MACKTAWKARERGLRVKQNKKWYAERRGIMLNIIRSRTVQDAQFRISLINTGDAFLIMDIANDAFLGVGRENNGGNVSGRSKMQMRDEACGQETDRSTWLFPDSSFRDLEEVAAQYGGVERTPQKPKQESHGVKGEMRGCDRSTGSGTPNKALNTKTKVEPSTSRQKPPSGQTASQEQKDTSGQILQSLHTSEECLHEDV